MTDCCIPMPRSKAETAKDVIKLHGVSFNQNTVQQSGNYTQEVQLIDISTTKTWMAYITKYQHERSLMSVEGSTTEDDRYYLTISEFKGVETDVQRYSYDITEAYDQDVPRTCMFLSISPDGTRVAISFARVDDIGFVESNPSHNRECLVYKVKKNKSALKLDKAIKFQGRAVFSKNNDLMLINKKVLKIYNEDYHKTNWFNLRSLGIDNEIQSKETFSAVEYTLKPRWALFNKDEFHDLYKSEIKDIITISRHIRHNILITPYRTKAQVWSITEKGVRLTSILKKPDEEIMAFSNNYKFLATFVDSRMQVNVYNVKSGLFLYKLTPQHQVPTGRQFEASYIRFCLDERYLVMTGLERDTSDNLYKAVGYEVWHIESEQSIYSKNIDTQLSTITSNKTFAPFVMIRPPGSNNKSSTTSQTRGQPSVNTAIESTAPMVTPSKSDSTMSPLKDESEEETLEQTIYALYVDYDSQGRNTLSHVESIDVYTTTTDEAVDLDNGISHDKGWKKVTSDLLDINGVYDAIIDPVQDKPTLCFIRHYLGRVYLLQFGNYMVQLWQLPINTSIYIVGEGENAVPDISGIDDLGELLFIHAYKAPYYGFTYTFRESWSVKENGITQEKCISFMQHTNIDIIDRIVIDITMDSNEAANVSSNNKDDFRAELFIPFKELVTPNTTFSENSLHLHLKSSCQALHYLHDLKHAMEKAESSGTEIVKVAQLLEMTQKIIAECVERIADNPAEYKYFCTITGSNILAMLASFKEGRKVIFQLLQIPKLRISLFSYAKKLTEEEEKEYLSTNENTLTVLIEKMSYDLYELLFNRILSDSKVVGIGSLSALTDVLIYLQETSNNDLLLSSSQKLSYLTVNTKIVPILESEATYILNMNMLKKNYIPSFRMMETFYFREQITEYEDSIICHIRYWWSKFWKNKTSLWDHIEDWSTSITTFLKLDLVIKFFSRRRHSPGKAAVLCVVPLPHFLTYSNFPEDRRNTPNTFNAKRDSNVIPNKAESAFVRIATNQNENSIFRQGDTVLEVLLQYKWNKFIQKYFILTYTICTAYYICYSIGISFSNEVFGYEPGATLSNGGQIVCITITLLSSLLLVVQEFRQFWKAYDKVLYAQSFYNWFDWTTYALSTASLALLLTGGANFEEVNTFATLFLWTHAILKLRIIPIVGISIETIIQLIKAVKGILLIMVLVICAFTNGFITLLSHKEDAYFQEQFEGTVSYPGFNESEAPNMALSDSSTSNDFGDVFNSFSIMWFLIFGVWDPITSGDAGDSKVIKVLAILFSFLVALIFSNIFIAYMNSAIEEVKARGTKACISHYAAIVAETEQLWCLKSTIYKRKYNPAYIYYIASEDAATEQEETLAEETQNLFKKLKAVYTNEKQPTYDKAIKDLRETLRKHGESLKNPDVPESVRKEWEQTDTYLNEKLESLKVTLRDVTGYDSNSANSH